MPEAWQRWYPHIIDKWLGSNELPELSDAAYRAVHYLLMAQFQSEDGMLPGDEKLLAKLSRKKAQWDEIREEVLGYFENGPDGKIYDRVMYGEWVRSRDIHSKRKAGGKSRWAKGELEDTSSTPQADLKDSLSSPIAHPTTVTGTVTETKTKEELDASACGRMLCEAVGCFDFKDQAGLAKVLDSYSRHSKKTPEEARDYLIAQWKKYEAMASRLTWVYGSAYKFFMSGKWDNPDSWPWKPGESPPTKNKSDPMRERTIRQMKELEDARIKAERERAEDAIRL